MRFVPEPMLNQYTILDKADELLRQSDKLFDYYEKNKRNLERSQLMMLTELRNLTFFEALSMINTLLRGHDDEEYVLDRTLYRDERKKFEKASLHHIRNTSGDHRGKNQIMKDGLTVVTGDISNSYINRVSKTVSCTLREVIDDITRKIGGKTKLYTDNVKFDFRDEMDVFRKEIR